MGGLNLKTQTGGVTVKVNTGGTVLRVTLARITAVNNEPVREGFVGAGSAGHYDTSYAFMPASVMVFVNGIKVQSSLLSLDSDSRGFTVSPVPDAGWEVEVYYVKA